MQGNRGLYCQVRTPAQSNTQMKGMEGTQPTPREGKIFKEKKKKHKQGVICLRGSGLGQEMWGNMIYKIIGQTIGVKPQMLAFRTSAETSGPHYILLPFS